MNKILTLLIFIFFSVFMISGCTAVSSPVSNGALFTNVQGPVAVTAADTYSKVGQSSCVAVLGIVSVGNASIDAAMKNGGIIKIHHVDHKSLSVLGVFSKFTTVVYGE